MFNALAGLLVSLTTIISLLGGVVISIYNIRAQSQVAQAVSSEVSGIQFTINDIGLQTLTYNGQNYLSGPATKNGIGSVVIGSALFRSPDGIEKPYGYLPNTLGDLNVVNALRSTSTNPFAYKHIYRQGEEESITLQVSWVTQDSRTLKIDIDITNNDATDSLARVAIPHLLPLVLPGVPLQPHTNSSQSANPLNSGYPTLFVNNTWGSVAYWMGDYSSNANLYSNVNQKNFAPIVNSYSSNKSGYKEDVILPGQTKRYTVFMRFGSSEETAASLAPEPLALVRQAYPYIVRWSDRRPIGWWFISEGTQRSNINPRGYLWDATLNVSSSTIFKDRVLRKADEIITRFNAMDPRPQGILVWDLEGQEFNHAFTYIGYPNKLPQIAPEMDAVADELFKKFTNAGYVVGMTLRPQKFGTGNELPRTCNFDAKISTLSDIFVKLNEPFRLRGFVCSATNIWTNAGQNWPGTQTFINDDDEILELLRSKISYARNRWGAKIFYVDSTGYGGGSVISFTVFRKLQQEFPDILLFPENEDISYFGASAPYNQVNMGSADTWSRVKEVYPEAFSLIQAINDVNYADPVMYNTMVQSVKNGNILLIDAWYDGPNNKNILKIYRDALITDSSTRTPHVVQPILPIQNQNITNVQPSTHLSLSTSYISFAPITLTLVGNNPAYILKGTQYFDPGVQVSGSTDYLFNIKANINGKDVGTINDIQLNTQVIGTSTIIYSVTDSQGKVGQITRNVVVQDNVTPTQTQQIVQSLPSVVVPFISRTISIGSKGTDVIDLQKFLITKGYLSTDTSPLGYYGNATREAVKKYQCKTMKLCTGDESTTGYGVVGQKTRALINTSSANGSTGASSITTSPSLSNSAEDSRIKALMEQIASLVRLVASLQEQLAKLRR